LLYTLAEVLDTRKITLFVESEDAPEDSAVTIAPHIKEAVIDNIIASVNEDPCYLHYVVTAWVDTWDDCDILDEHEESGVDHIHEDENDGVDES
jgi:hypothetical protein